MTNRRNSGRKGLRKVSKRRTMGATHAGRPTRAKRLALARKRRAAIAKQPFSYKTRGHEWSDNAYDFLEEGKRLMTIYKSRKLEHCNSAELSPFERPVGQFKRLAYGLIKRTISEPGGHNVIKSIVHYINHNGPSYGSNPFYSALLVMDEDRLELGNKHQALDRRTLALFANEMLYADRHNVPPCLLLGFLYQIGKPARWMKKLKAGELEPWTKDDRILDYAGPAPD